ncbi:MAG: formate dehydrogenase accessory sulfurtransferase FdhD [Planctomycetota bacterium]|jgi:FdhD protein
MQDSDLPVEGSFRRELAGDQADALVREEPLLLQVDGQQLLTMRTPGRDADLALGFLLSEAILEDPRQVLDSRFTPGSPKDLEPDRMTLHLDASLPEAMRGRLTRTHEIRSSCGICGLTDADEMLEGLKPLLPGVPRISEADIFGFRERFLREQPLFKATGASHSAAIFAADGSLLGAGEDVGRHNALDKAIGQASRSGADLSQGIVMLSGRAGFDLVLKCLRLRLPVILSISAASALSFDVCKAAGATLVGFLRESSLKIYCSGSRITGT